MPASSKWRKSLLYRFKISVLEIIFRNVMYKNKIITVEQLEVVNLNCQI